MEASPVVTAGTTEHAESIYTLAAGDGEWTLQQVDLDTQQVTQNIEYVVWVNMTVIYNGYKYQCFWE